MDSSDGRVVLAFLVGAAIGVGVGMLVAPAPGKETRPKIKDLARKAQERAQDLGSRFAVAAEEMADPAQARPGH
jgi:gas vesicle protein